MDGLRFDAIVRRFAARSWSRRGFLKLTGASLFGVWRGAGAHSPLEAAPDSKQIDAIAALVQAIDPALKGKDFRIFRSE